MKKSILLILFILCISSYASAQTNLITNSSFETGDLTGWSISVPTSWRVANGIDSNIYTTLPYEDILNFANAEEAFYLLNDLNYFGEFYVSDLTFSCDYEDAKFQKIKNELFVYCNDHIEFFDKWGGSGYLDGTLFSPSATMWITDYVDNNIIVITDYNIFNVDLYNDSEITNIYTIGEESPLDAFAGGFYFNDTLYVLEYGMNYPDGKFIAEYDNGVLTPVCDLGVGNFPSSANQFFVEGDGGVFLVSEMVANPVFFDGATCEIITDYNAIQSAGRRIANNSTVYYGGKFFTVGQYGTVTIYDADTNTLQDLGTLLGRLLIFDDELYLIEIESLGQIIFKFDSINGSWLVLPTHNLDTAIKAFEYDGKIYGYGSDGNVYQSRVDNPYIDEKRSYFYNIDGDYFLAGSIKSENENDYQLIYIQTIAPILEPGKEYEVKLNTGSIPPYAFNLSYGENFEDWEENKVSILTMPMAESTISITNDSEEAEELVIYINDIAYPNRLYYSLDNIRVYEVEAEQPSNSVDLNISTIGYIVNNSTYLGEQVTAGISKQGDLIGMAVGLFIALGLIFSLIFLVWKYGKNLVHTLFT